MKQRVRINEEQFKQIVMESVKKVLKEVTDYGNNIFGSAHMNQGKSSRFSDYHDYLELLQLKREVLKNFGNQYDINENYTNDSVERILFYGTINERPEVFESVKNFYKDNGWIVKVKDNLAWSGYNKYKQVVVTIVDKIEEPNV